MNYSKLVVDLLIVLFLAFIVVGEEAITNVSEENSSLGIMPVEETTVEILPLPTEGSVPIPEPPPTSDGLTGGLVIAPVIEQPLLTTIIELVLNKLSVIRGELVHLTASLFYEDGTPAVNKGINFYAGEEKIGSDTTNGAGKAKLLWDTTPFGPNVYVISAEYAGEEGVKGISAGQNVVITEKMPKATMLTTAAVVEPQAAGAVEEIQHCVNISFQDMEHTYGTCTRNMLRCSGLGNSTCATVEEQYRCDAGTQQVTKSYQQCKTTGLRVNNGQKIVEINLKDYACSTQERGGMITVTCDSVFDGNGDGVCHSGESCQQIVVNGTTIVRSEKNSEEEYKVDDDSYFMPEIGMVVLQ